MGKRKKKSRFGYYLYAFVALVLAILNLTIAVFLLTYVQGISVSGAQYSSKSQVEAWVKEDPYTINSIYAVSKFKFGNYELPSYLEEVKVGFAAPWKLSVRVKEKEVVGCILSSGNYVYFADDGTVMQKSTEVIEGIPVVEGFHAEDFEVFETMKVEDEKTFSYIREITQEVKKNSLSPDGIVWADEGVVLYFEEICVQLGKMNYEEKLIQLPPILEKLEGKRGTLHLEHYNETSTSISFVEDKE